MKSKAGRIAVTQIGLLAITTCLLPVLLQADTPSSCAATVVTADPFPSASNYVCSDGYNYWLGFTDLGAITPGETALPTGTMLYATAVAPGTVAITLEPGGTAQFLPGQTYSWEYEFVESSPGNTALSAAGSDYGAAISNPTLTTTINALNVVYPDGVFSPTVGSQLASLTLSNGALQMAAVSGFDGLQFVNTLSGIGQQTFIQSISNEIFITSDSNSINPTPEPKAIVLFTAGLVFVLLIVRFRRNRGTETA